LIQNKASMGLLGFSFFISAANDNVFVIYGAWFEQNFQLSVKGLGLSAAVIGAAELAGEFLTAMLSDRLGLKRAVIAGTAISSSCYLLLLFCSGSLLFSFFSLFLIFMFFEFTIVSSISLCTELLPGSRATMMAGFLAAAGLGRVTGALLGGPLWVVFGIAGTVSVSCLFCAISLAFFSSGMKDWR
jgi:predicted MFS family arabinose efflux permease